MKSPPLDRSWAAASWQGARDNTRRLGESLTLAEKLAWLEEAEQLALSLGKRGQGVCPNAVQEIERDAPSGARDRRR
jgi:hypothetical protein